MKKTDMELQAIREKLRLLESEPIAGDVLSKPWGSPQSSAFGSAVSSSTTFGAAASGRGATQTVRHSTMQPTQPAHIKRQTQSSGASPQAVAIEALKQRSSAQNNRADEMIAQEIYRMEVHAQNINERSQQQAKDLLALKQSAQQATLAFRRQGIHSHPQLDTIAKFLESYPSTTVPHLERDSQGHFALSHTTINLHQAEQEAQSTAETLRSRPFSQPIATGPTVSDYIDDDKDDIDKNSSEEQQPNSSAEDARRSRLQGRTGRRRKRWNTGLMQIIRLFTRQAPSYSAPANSQFSWLDGAIWFSGAAIVRIIVEAVVLSYPILRMPLLLIMFSVISFSIYRVVVSQSPSLTSAYKLGIVLLGLFLGGSL